MGSGDVVFIEVGWMNRNLGEGQGTLTGLE
jgi:hypothetical protein